MRRTALLLTYGSVISILFSIALSQTLLGAALLAVLASRTKVRFPPIKLPLLLFFVWTVLSDVHSGHFVQGLPQIRKFFVFVTALVIASSFKTARDAAILVWSWTAVGLVSSACAFWQLHHRYLEAQAEGATYYEYFLDYRLRGLAGHWMTFGGEIMILSLMLLAYALGVSRTRARILAFSCLPIFWVSLLLGLTRGVFLFGVPAGAAYLLYTWRRWTVIAIPAALTLAWLVLPFQVGERIRSVIRPHGDDDSNLRRIIFVRTGMRMIRAHPLLGLGPEQVGRQFLSYVPPDIARPLPKGWYGHLHNIYLQYSAERGVPALAFVLWMLGRILADLHREAQRRNGVGTGRWVLRGAVAVVLAVMTEGLFEHNLGDSEVLTMFLAVISCGYVVRAYNQQTLETGDLMIGSHAPTQLQETT